MAKGKVTLTVDALLIEMAKSDGMNISRFLENKLAEYYNFHREEARWISNDDKIDNIKVVDA